MKTTFTLIIAVLIATLSSSPIDGTEKIGNVSPCFQVAAEKCITDFLHSDRIASLTVPDNGIKQTLSQRTETTNVLYCTINLVKLLFWHVVQAASDAQSLLGFNFQIFQSVPSECSYYFLRLCVLSSQAHPPTM